MAAVDSSDLDVVVGCISGLSFEQIAPWVGSLDACGFRGRRIVIYLRVDPQTVAELERRGYETYDASDLHNGGKGVLKKNPQDDEISVNRFYYIWHFLSQVAPTASTRYLVATDASDVIFQRNPSVWLEQNLGQKRLVAGCESLHFEDEPWGAETMLECYGPQVWEAYRRKLIYNAGTIAGEFQTMIDLCLQVYMLSRGNPADYSDQQALNLLLGSAIYQEITCFASSEDGWACQAGTIADPDLLQKVRHLLTCPPPSFDGEYVRTAAGNVFTLVHQYNRVPEWHMPLKNKYSAVATTPSPIVGSAGGNSVRFVASGFSDVMMNRETEAAIANRIWHKFRSSRLWRRLRNVGFLRNGLYLGIEARRSLRELRASSLETVDQDFLDRSDPFRYETNPLEHARFLHQTELLDDVRKGQLFESGLEIGCAEGLYTEVLAERCASLLVLDLSPTALARAQSRRRWSDKVRFSAFDLRRDAVPGTFDLIIVAGVLEYFSRPATLAGIREKLAAALRPNGYLLVETTRVNPIVENAWWGRRLIRGKWISAYISEHPSLTVTSSVMTDGYSVVLCRKLGSSPVP